ncbi:MAG: S-adenosylmethionine:tRNA ribosyltransferase-isomerase, partial [Candidatus Sumerlaeia bacterium]|nr:S-adenosylmethionine:tRNA ribosyltransferase-isomerase [Candidatus Sumerlaeia bacterium]
MKTELFDYPLPEELIARYPAQKRDESRLMVLERATGSIQHAVFKQLPAYLRPADLLVFNESKVIPARLIGRKLPFGGNVEVFLLRELEPHHLWKTLVRPGKKIKPGDRIVFKPGVLEGEVIGYAGKGERLIHFKYTGDWWDCLSELGKTPLPPYIIKARKRNAGKIGKSFPWEETVSYTHL